MNYDGCEKGYATNYKLQWINRGTWLEFIGPEDPVKVLST
jgi:hypothetical protein